MKRADTGEANFTAISWGEDILEMVEYKPVYYFSDAIEEAEQEAPNISPSQTAALESKGRFPSEGKHFICTSKGKAVGKAGLKIVVGVGKGAGLQQGATTGKISDVFNATAGPAGEPTTIRVPPSRPTSRRR